MDGYRAVIAEFRQALAADCEAAGIVLHRHPRRDPAEGLDRLREAIQAGSHPRVTWQNAVNGNRRTACYPSLAESAAAVADTSLEPFNNHEGHHGLVRRRPALHSRDGAERDGRRPVTDYTDLKANIAETHRMRHLDVVTGPCDPGLFPGKVATIRRMRADQVERGMTLGSFIWPPFCWPVARPDCLLHLWPVETVTWKPVHGRDWPGQPVYRGQQVTLTFSGDLAAWAGRDNDFVSQVTDLRNEEG